MGFALLLALGCSDSSDTEGRDTAVADVEFRESGTADSRLQDVSSDVIGDSADASEDAPVMPADQRIASLTCDADALQAAAEYEQLFFDHFEQFRTNVRTFGSTRSDASWFTGSYGGRTGGQLYFYKPMVESLVRVMLLAEHLGDRGSHVEGYIEFAIEILDDLIPKLLSGHGTEVALESNPNYDGYNPNSLYHPNGAREPAYSRHKFLDATRGLSFFGYAMWGILQTAQGNTGANRQLFRNYANELQPAIEVYESIGMAQSARDAGGFSHMGGHPAMGAAFLRVLSEDYGSSFEDLINYWVGQVVENVTETNWIGSDVGHATDSTSALFAMHDLQMAAMAVPGQTRVPDAALAAIGERFDSTSDSWPGSTGVSPEHEHQYALTVRLSPSVRARLAAPTQANYPELNAEPTGSHPNNNAFVTIAAGAYGHALRLEGDAPCLDATPVEPESCTAEFGTAQDFILCEESSTSCTFSARLADGSGTCRQLCASFESVCLDAADNGVGTCDVVSGETDDCDTVRTDNICECAR